MININPNDIIYNIKNIKIKLNTNKINFYIDEIIRLEKSISNKFKSDIEVTTYKYNNININFSYCYNVSNISKFNSNTNLDNIYIELSDKLKNIDYKAIFKSSLGRGLNTNSIEEILNNEVSKVFRSGTSEKMNHKILYKKYNFIFKLNEYSKSIKKDINKFNDSYNKIIFNIQNEMSKINISLYEENLLYYNKYISNLFQYIQNVNLFYLRILEIKCKEIILFLSDINDSL